MILRHVLSIGVLALAALVQNLAAGESDLWRTFALGDGLPENTCLNLSLGTDGDLLIRHPTTTTLSVLDGYGVRELPAPPKECANVKAGPGTQFWTTSPDGLWIFQDGRWALCPVQEIINACRTNAATPVQLHPVRPNRVLLLLPNRLLQLDLDAQNAVEARLLQSADQTRLGTFTTLSPARDGGLWVSGTKGIAKLTGPLRDVRADGNWQEQLPADHLGLSNYRLVQEDKSGNPSVQAELITTAQPVMARFQDGVWTAQALPEKKLRFAWRASGQTWAVAGNSLIEVPEDGSTGITNADIVTRHIFDVAVEPDGTFWLATYDGLFRHPPALWTPAPRSGPTPAQSRRRPPLPQEIEQHAAWNCFLVARNGDLWLGSAGEIAWRHRNAWRFFLPETQLCPKGVQSFAEAPDGRIYCATTDKIWLFDQMSWRIMNGRFNRIHDLFCARDGTLWVSTDSSLQRLVQGTWVPNSPKDGLPASPVSSITEDENGQIFARTDDGSFLLESDVDLDPPDAFIVPDSTTRHREGAVVTVAFGGRDKWKQTVDTRLYFSYRLDEREWSPFQALTGVSFDDLSTGRHFFQIRAMDRNGNFSPRPARLEFTVLAPWYQEPRLVLVLVFALVVAVFFAALAFNRHRRLLRSYAEVERAIAERTRELELANQELLHSQKMNALGTLAAGIAHDFNNILSIIKGSAQIIEDNTDNPEKIHTRIDRIKTVVHQGAGIVEAMLGFSRTSGQAAAPCNLNAVVDDTITLLGDRFLRETEVHLDQGEGLPEVTVARDCVQQALLNFIFNAAEAMITPRRIILTTRRIATLPPGMVLAPAASGDCLTVAVTDFGCGIPLEILPRVFEPFFTTKAMSARRGTGLGLSMVYELAKKMNAGIAVETAVGRGSTFTLILPIHPPEPD